jgi:acetyltransferase
MTTQGIRPTRALRPAPEAHLVPWQPAVPVVRIRPIRPADGEALERFYRDLSPESRRARFFGATAGLSHAQSSFFCTPDHCHREGFVVETPNGDQGPPRVVGHLCLEPDGARTAEVAIAVSDAFQGRGIGRRLMNAGLAWAAHEGISTLTATMLESNVGIRSLISSTRLPVSFRPIGSNVLAVTIDLRLRSAAA